jgi:hypothetical protein
VIAVRIKDITITTEPIELKERNYSQEKLKSSTKMRKTRIPIDHIATTNTKMLAKPKLFRIYNSKFKK